ncbi:MAG TPA: FAD-dependent oxidoreductase [Jatrophihabitans sp.]|nr:FAD-dependent oxidoreductase [Jatrophihabitans sp.]
MIDVLVVGGGPVGLASALFLDRAGLSVTVLEQRAGPIDKACGEGLLPPAVRTLAGLDVRPAGWALGGIRYLDGGHRVDARFRTGPGLGVRRTELQSALGRAVRARGIPIEQVRAGALEQDAASVRVAGLTARYLVAADGLHSGIRRRLGLQRASRRRPRWGQRRHVGVAPWTDLVEVHWSTQAEAYVTPTGPEQVGVAILSASRVPFSQALQSFPALAQRLGGLPHGPVLGAGPLRQRVGRRVAGRVLLAGDAAGYVDALTGEGLSIGLVTAARLAGCLAADRPADYERAWRQATRRYRLLTEGLVALAGNRVSRPLIVPAAARLPGAFAAIVNQLAGEPGPPRG